MFYTCLILFTKGRGVSVQGGGSVWGDLCPGGVSVRGVLGFVNVFTPVCDSVHRGKGSVQGCTGKSGWCASYWNAFLLVVRLLLAEHNLSCLSCMFLCIE